MTTYHISKSFSRQGSISEKAASVMRMFGLTVERLNQGAVTHKCKVEINNSDIVYITGPSGAGKSVLLRELQKGVPAYTRINLSDIELPNDKMVIDCVEGNFISSLRLLSTAGLNDVFCVLNKPAFLSEGQKYRLQLAMTVGSGKKFIFADEFCSNLDRITAAVISYNLHKIAKRENITFVLASSHSDILADLQPDVLVVKELAGQTEIIYKDKSRK